MGRFTLKILLASAAVIAAAGCTEKSKYNPDDWYDGNGGGDGGNAETVVDEDGSMKIMSFNVRYGSGDTGTQNDWDVRKSDLYTMIQEEKPLVIGSQECQINQKTDILSNCKEYGAVGVGRNDGKNSGETCSIFYHKSSCRIADWGSFWLSETPDVAGSKGWDAANIRIATWAKVELLSDGRQFFFINTHLDHKGTVAREEEMKLIMKKFEELNTGKLPQVLTADFNTSQDDDIFTECLKTMKNARIEAPVTDNHATYNGFVGGKTTMIDHIFLSGFEILKFKTVDQKWGNTQFISDHFPVYALVKFEE